MMPQDQQVHLLVDGLVDTTGLTADTTDAADCSTALLHCFRA